VHKSYRFGRKRTAVRTGWYALYRPGSLTGDYAGHYIEEAGNESVPPRTTRLRRFMVGTRRDKFLSCICACTEVSMGSRAFLSCLLFLTTACSDSSTNTEELSGCVGDVAVSGTAGTSPTFSWTPRCKVMFLLVEPAGSGSDLWSISTDGRNGIAPGVRYGVVPAGAVAFNPAISLSPGTSYELILYRHTGPGPDDAAISAIHIFTP
jgi:hypothetical protein